MKMARLLFRFIWAAWAFYATLVWRGPSWFDRLAAAIALALNLVVTPALVLRFLATGKVRSPYGGEYHACNMSEFWRGCPPADVLAAHLDGGMEMAPGDPIERGLIHAHLGECAQCAEIAAAVQAIRPENDG